MLARPVPIGFAGGDAKNDSDRAGPFETHLVFQTF